MLAVSLKLTPFFKICFLSPDCNGCSNVQSIGTTSLHFATYSPCIPRCQQPSSLPSPLLSTADGWCPADLSGEGRRRLVGVDDGCR
ncbi:hypothetical protein RchiOBHm_Chr2g0166811 [Rosa chinensis]|uniref:Uncharacterized protein n=1 Tax=Rosa chinensis TaxID=74649 RepID=A0A2P6S455_ROSCH|nr:hypothetical protein RchiOBHm_Chr2g0166811 [Rosa chinensis]